MCNYLFLDASASVTFIVNYYYYVQYSGKVLSKIR